MWSLVPFVAGLRDRYDLMVGFAYAVYYGKTGIHAFKEEILIFPLVSVPKPGTSIKSCRGNVPDKTLDPAAPYLLE